MMFPDGVLKETIDAAVAVVVLAAVNNTFGEMHNYWVTSGTQVRKAFHVSPFIGR